MTAYIDRDRRRHTIHLHGIHDIPVRSSRALKAEAVLVSSYRTLNQLGYNDLSNPHNSLSTYCNETIVVSLMTKGTLYELWGPSDAQRALFWRKQGGVNSRQPVEGTLDTSLRHDRRVPLSVPPGNFTSRERGSWRTTFHGLNNAAIASKNA